MAGTPIPIPQIGEANLPHGVYVARCRFGAGTSASDGLDVYTDTQGTFALFNINSSGILVHKVDAAILEAFNAGVTLTVGDGADADGFLRSTEIAATVVSSGLVRAADTDVSWFTSRLYISTDSIDVVVGGADPTAGIMEAYVMYSYAPQEAYPDTGGSVNT